MDVFLELLSDMFPLYVIMGLGYLSGKLFSIDTKSVATLAVYIIAPIVFLLTVAQMDFIPAALVAPLLIFGLSTAMGFAALKAGRYYLEDKTRYLSAVMAGTSNWGYFGLPIAFVLFEPEIVALYMIVGYGTMVYDNSFGVYFISRGNYTPAESLKNVVKYPVIYALIAGLSFSYLQFDLLVYTGQEFFDYFKGAYVVLGMMIIGFGLADMTRFTVDMRFLATVFAVRFMIWPVAVFALVMADRHFFQLLGEAFYAPLLLFSLMPMGANNVAFAAKFDMNPGKAAVACLATTLFAVVYVPLAVMLLKL